MRQNEAITVTVSMPDGSDLSGWFMRMVDGQGNTKMPPRRLDAYGAPRQGAPGTHDCTVSTIGFEPGEHLVDLSTKASFDLPDIVSKKFTVVPHRIVIASVGMGERDNNPVLFGTLRDPA